MKADNIFDYLESENTIGNGSVIEKTGVKTDNVMKLVKERLEEENSGGKIKPLRKKGRTAKVFATLLAAAITLTAVTAQALGGFKDAFGDFFIGESPDGIYEGDNLSIESETSNIEFLGIAGDKNTACVSLKIKENDGSDYIDNIENTWISSSSSSMEENYTFYHDIVGNTSFSRSVWSELTEREPIASCFGFYFEDTSTINAYILLNGDEGGIKGETMTAEISNLSAYTCKEVLYDFSEHYEENSDGESCYTMEDFNKNLIEIVKIYGFEENDGKRLMVNPETKDIVLAEEMPIDVEFSLSVQMNYKTSSVTLETQNLSELFSNWSSGKITVQPFTMILNANISDSKSDTSAARFPDEINITLNDGNTVTAYYQNVTNDDSKYIVTYRYYNDKGDGSRFMPTAINPQSVVSIESNSVIIYE